MAARQVFDTMDKDGEGIIDRSACDNAMSLLPRPSSTPRSRARSRSPTAASSPRQRAARDEAGGRRDDARGGQGRHGPDAGRENCETGPKVKVGGKPKMSKWAALKAKSKMLIGFGVKSKAAVPMVTLADGTKVPASEVKPGTPLQGGATMPEIKPGEAVVTLADGSVVPASSVKPARRCRAARRCRRSRAAKSRHPLADGSVVSASETVTLADGTVVAAKDVKPGTPLAGRRDDARAQGEDGHGTSRTGRSCPPPRSSPARN